MAEPSVVPSQATFSEFVDDTWDVSEASLWRRSRLQVTSESFACGEVFDELGRQHLAIACGIADAYSQLDGGAETRTAQFIALPSTPQVPISHANAMSQCRRSGMLFAQPVGSCFGVRSRALP